ncbi:FAD-dependent monooxygenase [Mucilaginibacter antarcticus]|uniref:FAD-dependent monooxygenase n=1 Tax=Mucilaginibacter antarcticus TaxID=1855725 RepID=UPI00363B1C06
MLKAKQNQHIIQYECDYLIGCDGIKSSVREFTGIPFDGGAYQNVFSSLIRICKVQSR